MMKAFLACTRFRSFSSGAKSFRETPLFMKSDSIELRSQRSVPQGATHRMLNMGTLGASIVGSGISEAGMSKPVDATYKGIKKFVVTKATAEKIADSLCKMRGAALKLGQALSTLDDNMVPPLIKSALERARAEADFLPDGQLMESLKERYGEKWNDIFANFNMTPIAAASIGQVHEAVLRKNGERVAVKVQYPGIAECVDQDMDNFKRIVKLTGILPKGLFVEHILEGVRTEFKEECDYIKEAEKLEKYKEMLKDNKHYHVPKVYREYTNTKCLCMEFVEGTPIDRFIDKSVPQELRDHLGTLILGLCLREIFLFKFMQTDPNPANFFYNMDKDQLVLIDLGAGKTFDKLFVDEYMGVVLGAAKNDTKKIIEHSKNIGLLTGEESRKMINAHVKTTLILGEAFSDRGEPFYDFSAQDVTNKVYELLPIMIENRLTPPPNAIIPLHRKLSGAFFQLVRLKAKVKTRKLFYEIYDEWKSLANK